MRVEKAAPAMMLVALVAVVGSPTRSALAQGSDHDWSKNYQVSAHPQLTLEAGDSGMEIRSCGSCSNIQIAVHSDQKLSDYVLSEHQEGNHVFFSLKDRNRVGVHFSFSMHNRGPKITVETPGNLSLDAKVSDGSVSAQGLNGELKMQSSDGSVTAEDVHGMLDFKTSDGSINVRRAGGEINGRSSDGSVDVEGQFSRLDLHTSDGSITLALAEGSKLTAPSRLSSSDGHIHMRVPRSLDADLAVSASDGHIECELPLKMDGFNTKGGSQHHIAGHLNAGGTPLDVKVSDGNVKIAAL